jgi:hypothetical protein
MPVGRAVAGGRGGLSRFRLSAVLDLAKGAMNNHRAIVNRAQWMQETFRLTAADRVLRKAPASLDVSVSVRESFWHILAGAARGTICRRSRRPTISELAAARS